MSGSRQSHDGQAIAPSGALGPADPRTLALAADILRERTMSLDPDESLPAKRLVLTAIGTTIVAAICLVVFRQEVRWLIGLI